MCPTFNYTLENQGFKSALDISVKILKENMPKRFCPNLLTWIFLLLAATSAVLSQETPKLVLTQAIERAIKGGEIHSYAVQIGANQTARVEIVQKGVDVSLAAFRPTGEKFIEAESPSGLQGNERQDLFRRRGRRTGLTALTECSHNPNLELKAKKQSDADECRLSGI